MTTLTEELAAALNALTQRYELYAGGPDAPHAGETDRALLKQARAALSRYEAEKEAPEDVVEKVAPVALKGVGRRNGDGWKDTTKLGEVVFVWNEELPAPHSPGQYPRIGCEHWTASTEQYEFTPATTAEIRAALSALTLPKEVEGPVAWLRDAHEGEGDECLVPAAKGDPGAFPVYRKLLERDNG